MLDACFAKLSRGVVGFAGVVEGLGFATGIADLAVEGEGLLVVVGGLLVVALPLVDEAEVAQREGFTGRWPISRNRARARWWCSAACE